MNRLSFITLLQADLLRQHTLMHSQLESPPSIFRLWLGIASWRIVPVLLYRLAHALHNCSLYPLAKAVSMVNFFFFGIEISARCPIGPGLFLPHTQGTVIGAWSIGANATIFQGVTLGARKLDFNYDEFIRPTLKNNVIVGAGAKVLGGVLLADNSCIGANSVVLIDVPAGALAVGLPARIVQYLPETSSTNDETNLIAH